MKLYRYFRHIKYGEPRPVEEKKIIVVSPSYDSKPILIQENLSEYGEEMQQELNQLQLAKITIARRKRSRGARMPRRNKGNELNEDLGTVIEEESVADSEMNSAFKTRDPRSLYS